MDILLVEDNPATRQIVRDILQETPYDITAYGNGNEGYTAIDNQGWDLIILDIMLPGKDGYELLGFSKKIHKFTPVIMFTALKDRNKKIKAYNMGVNDFISKPVEKWEFLARVRSLLALRESYQKLEETKNIVKSLAHAVEAKDPYTSGHSDRVGKYCKKIALKVGFSEEKAEDLYWAGLLHDIGKIAVPLDILTKPGKLTEEEYKRVKEHPKVSHKICKDLRTLQKVLPAVKYHHERWDGKGYPSGLAGKEIPVEARIMSVADAFDAMTSDRSYRKALSRQKALRILKEEKNKQFQGTIVDTLLEILDKKTIEND